MHFFLNWRRAAVSLLTVTSLAAAGLTAVPGPAAAQSGARSEDQVSSVPICITWKHRNGMIKRVLRAVDALHPNNTVSFELRDSYLGVECWYHPHVQFYSASTIKATILASLLLKAQEEHRQLTAYEKAQAWLMITQSDNSAATNLWNDVGMSHIQHFLNLAHMTETVLNPAWGVTLETAHDETLLLRLLMYPNHILTNASRRYELYLMHNVIPAQQWGARTGAPARFTWHIKNGWAPNLPAACPNAPWTVDALGAFTSKVHDYSLVIMSDCATGAPGVTNIYAEAINHAMYPHAKYPQASPPPSPSWKIPDEPAWAMRAGGAGVGS
jgi:hypothetical protein